MSVTIFVIPVIIGGWPLLASLAAAAAAGLGFKMIKQSKVQAVEQENQIELTDEKSQIIEDSLKPEEELVFTRSGVTVTIKKDLRDKFTICVRAKNKTNEELTTTGRLFLNKIKQQYAYQKVTEEMTKRGYNIIQEQKEGQRIKITLRRF